MNRKILLIVVSLFFSTCLFSQSFLGYNYSNYQTAGGMLFNPASIANSKYNVNVNLFSLNISGATNAYTLNKNELLNSNSFEENINYFKENNSDLKNMFFNIDFIGPSFMMDLGPKIGAFGLSSRVRFLLDERGLDNDIFQLLGQSNPDYFDRTFTQNGLMLDAHAFADIGLTYARTIWANKNHMIKGGATLKYVIGTAGGSLRIDNLKVHMNSDFINGEEVDVIKELKGDITVLYSKGIDDITNDNSKVSDMWSQTENGGFGFDLGFEYEWYSKGDYIAPVTDRSTWYQNVLTPYTIKASVSLTDVGSVKYTPSAEARNYQFDITNDVFASELNSNDNDLNDYIEQLKDKGYIKDMGDVSSYRMSLPTML